MHTLVFGGGAQISREVQNSYLLALIQVSLALNCIFQKLLEG